ncbi:histone H2A [Hamiltosporidium tvaerminnensis]|uniref:Histone H2A n=1 Tax=Hamiltosporidium tvaerminnensis TaxID=1176355 RepID=A0A4Q9M039_9MICR|nr:histone H2A [Hamiltosporidium tvaerminnensis]
MASGKGGKKDPITSSKREASDPRSVCKLNQLHRIIRTRTRMRVSQSACVAVAAGLVYLMGEILEGSKAAAEEEGKKKILPKHINLAICKDEELGHVGHDWLIKGGGVKSAVSHDLQSSKRGKQTVFCYIKDRNVIRGVEREYQQCNMSGKTLKHFAIDSINENNLSPQEISTDNFQFSAKIIPKIISWDGIRLQIPINVEVYIYSIALKKTLKLNNEESWERASIGVIKRAKIHEEPTYHYK